MALTQGPVEAGQLAEDDRQHDGQADAADHVRRLPPDEPGLVEHDLAERGGSRGLRQRQWP